MARAAKHGIPIVRGSKNFMRKCFESSSSGGSIYSHDLRGVLRLEEVTSGNSHEHYHEDPLIFA